MRQRMRRQCAVFLSAHFADRLFRTTCRASAVSLRRYRHARFVRYFRRALRIRKILSAHFAGPIFRVPRFRAGRSFRRMMRQRMRRQCAVFLPAYFTDRLFRTACRAAAMPLRRYRHARFVRYFRRAFRIRKILSAYFTGPIFRVPLFRTGRSFCRMMRQRVDLRPGKTVFHSPQGIRRTCRQSSRRKPRFEQYFVTPVPGQNRPLVRTRAFRIRRMLSARKVSECVVYVYKNIGCITVRLQCDRIERFDLSHRIPVDHYILPKRFVSAPCPLQIRLPGQRKRLFHLYGHYIRRLSVIIVRNRKQYVFDLKNIFRFYDYSLPSPQEYGKQYRHHQKQAYTQPLQSHFFQNLPLLKNNEQNRQILPLPPFYHASLSENMPDFV